MFTTHPVIDFMPDQRDLEDKGGTMRLGLYPAKLTPGSKAARGLRRGDHLRAAPPPLRGQQPLPPDARGGRHDPVRPVARRPPRRDRRAARTTRGSWRASSTPSSRAGPSGRTRCSTGSWPRRSRSRDGREPEPARPESAAPRFPASGPRPRPMSSSPSPGLKLADPAVPGRPCGRGVRLLDLWRCRPRGRAWLSRPARVAVQPPHLPANIVGVWLGVAFALGGVGADDPDRRSAGLIGLLSAVGVYYLLFATLGEGSGSRAPGTRPRCGASSPSSPGRSWAARRGLALRHGPARAIGVAVLAAALIGEGVVFGVGG